MRIIDDKVLAHFRQQPCEVCGYDPPSHPHHIFERQMGAGNRLDIPWNLLSLCPSCHEQAHSGEWSREELLAMASTREIRKIQRAPK